MATKAEVIEVVNARAGMYETLATLYFDRLTEEQIQHMARSDYAELRASENPLIASGFNDIWRYLRKRNTATRQELNIDFSSCFLGTHAYKGFVAQPYESLFLDQSGSLNAAPRREVFKIYKSECVSLQKGYDYPDDHLSFECEFMMILCQRTVAALEADDLQEATRLLNVQLSFLEQHINRWFRRLHDLSLKFIKTRFYRGVLNVTQGFFDEDPNTIRELIELVGAGFDEEPTLEEAGFDEEVSVEVADEDQQEEGDTMEHEEVPGHADSR